MSWRWKNIVPKIEPREDFCSFEYGVYF